MMGEDYEATVALLSTLDFNRLVLDLEPRKVEETKLPEDKEHTD